MTNSDKAAIFEARRDLALRLLAASGIAQWRKTPPFFRLLWSCGIRIRPPHVASFLSNFVFFGALVGVIWILLSLPYVWSRHGTNIMSMVWPGAAVAGFSGLVAAIDFWRAARKHKLPKWSELRAEADVFD